MVTSLDRNPGVEGAISGFPLITRHHTTGFRWNLMKLPLACKLSGKRWLPATGDVVLTLRVMAGALGIVALAARPT
jgi:hypothetical protein